MIRSFLLLIRTTYGLYFILLLFFFFLKTKGSSDHNLREAQGRGYQPQEPRMESEAKASLYGKVERCLVQRKYQWKKKWFSCMQVACRLPQAWYVDWGKNTVLIFVSSSLYSGNMVLCPRMKTWSDPCFFGLFTHNKKYPPVMISCKKFYFSKLFFYFK